MTSCGTNECHSSSSRISFNSDFRGCSTWFPAPRSPSSLTCGPHPSAAPTGCRSLGTQERTQWAFPAATATPERTTGKPSPTPARSRPPPRAAPPLEAKYGFTREQLFDCSLSVPQRACRVSYKSGNAHIRCRSEHGTPALPFSFRRRQNNLFRFRFNSSFVS